MCAFDGLVIDLYGESKISDAKEMNGHATTVSGARTREVIHLSLCDALPAYGPISAMTFSVGRNGVCLSQPPSLRDCSRAHVSYRNGSWPNWWQPRDLRIWAGLRSSRSAHSYHLQGLPVSHVSDPQRELPSRTKKKLHAIGGTRGMWSLPVRQSKASGPATAQGEQLDTLIISTDASPSPGLSRVSNLCPFTEREGRALPPQHLALLQIAVRNTRNEISIVTRLSGLTVAAAPFFQGTAILHVMSVGNVNQIRILEPGKVWYCVVAI